MSAEIDQINRELDSIKSTMATKSDMALYAQKLDSHESIQEDVVKEMRETTSALRELTSELKVDRAEKAHIEKRMDAMESTQTSHQKVMGSVELLMHDQKKKDKRWGVAEKVVIAAVTTGFLAMLAKQLMQ